MAKYRGKHNGQTRGKYTRKLFLHETNDFDHHEELITEIDHYLGDRGIQFFWGGKEEEETYSFHSNAHHLGGASIGLEARWTEPNKGRPRGRIYLSFVSNDSLDDVVKKVIDNFPIFKERKDY